MISHSPHHYPNFYFFRLSVDIAQYCLITVMLPYLGELGHTEALASFTRSPRSSLLSVYSMPPLLHHLTHPNERPGTLSYPDRPRFLPLVVHRSFVFRLGRPVSTPILQFTVAISSRPWLLTFSGILFFVCFRSLAFYI
jgi:hypothetical protein